METKHVGGDVTKFFVKWKQCREEFVKAWEQSQSDWHQESVKRAIEFGDIAVWRLLGDNWKNTSRSMVNDEGSILTDPDLIKDELINFHKRSKIENSAVPPGRFETVRWEEPFSESDEIL